MLSIYVSPDSFPVLLSIRFLVGIVVGGLASVSALSSARFSSSSCPTSPIRYPRRPPEAIYGMFLIAFMYFMPMGSIWASSISSGVPASASGGHQAAKLDKTAG